MSRHGCLSRRLSLLPLLLITLVIGLAGCSGPCEANPGPSLDPQLLSARGLIYLNSPDSKSLYAINMRNGSIRWASQISGSTMLDDDILYVYDLYANDSNSYDIEALNASDGIQLWQRNGRDGMYVSTLVAAQDHIAYVFEDNGMLMAVNGRDGSLIWQHLLKDDPASSMHDGPSTLQIINGVVYVSTVNSSIFAFREQDGALLWQFHTTRGDQLNTLRSTAFGDGMIFLSADQTYTLRLSDGKLLWHSAQVGTLAEANNVLYLGAVAGFVSPESVQFSDSFYALRASDGTQIWHTSFMPTSPAESRQEYRMQLLDNVLYIIPVNYGYNAIPGLSALRTSDGKRLWEHSLQNIERLSLFASQGIVYLLSWNSLEALRETDGSSVWSRSFQQRGLLVGSDALYAGSGGNTTSPCGPYVSAQIERLNLSDASPAWFRTLDPAPTPDPFLSAKILFFVPGAALLCFSLLFFFISRRGQTKSRLLQPYREGTALIVPVPSSSWIKSMGWLLFLVPGVIALLIAAVLITR
jgi:outer membrane protein assembly factor BamB